MDLEAEKALSENLIQLRNQISKNSNRMLESYQNARPGKLHPSNSILEIRLPKRFRELRALFIACWYFPDWLKFNILLGLNGKIFSLDWKNKGLERSLELDLLSTSEKMMLLFVQKEINPRVLFGTILQEDLKNALQNLEIVKENSKNPRRKIRRKGYQDKGTWRPPHRWIETSDWTFKELWYQRERQILVYQALLHIYRYTLSREGF